MEWMRSAIRLCSGRSSSSLWKPGPSLDQISTIRRWIRSPQNTPAYTARFPPLEWPPSRSFFRGYCRATLSAYRTAFFWAGTSGIQAISRSSFQPARVSSVPRKER